MTAALFLNTSALVKRYIAEQGSDTEVTDSMINDACELVAQRPLRAYDAVQLASAQAFASQCDENIRFATADTRLLEAARAEGLSAEYPE